MKSILMMKTALRIVNHSARIQSGENVCIVGDNHTIGGRLQSNVHLDGVILNPTVEIDSHLIVKKGILLPVD
jgi:hypothetical protein